MPGMTARKQASSTAHMSARLASCFASLLLSSSLSTLGILSVPDASTGARVAAVITDWQACCCTRVMGPLAAQVREDRFPAGCQPALLFKEGPAERGISGWHVSPDVICRKVNANIAELSWPVLLRVSTDGAGGVSKVYQQVYQREIERWYDTGLSGQAVTFPAAAAASKDLTAQRGTAAASKTPLRYTFHWRGGAQAVSGKGGGGTSGEMYVGAAGCGCSFVAVETSTLADGVGLLNLLLCCAPLLKQHASAHLVTGSD
eukprot:jgi/Mesen1/4872/ME000244S04058